MSTDPDDINAFSVFSADACIAQGSITEVAVAARHFLDTHPKAQVLILDDATCRPVDLDLSGDLELVSRKAAHYPVSGQRSEAQAPSTREVSLLPRHWDWLTQQPGNPSAALRRLIDEARRDPKTQIRDKQRQAQQLTFQFCQALCGDLQDYEGAMRALYRQDQQGFEANIQQWPKDFASRASVLAEPSWLGPQDSALEG